MAAVPDDVLSPLPEGLGAALIGVVGERHALFDPQVTAGWAVDWTGRFCGSTPAVVRPADVEQVVGVVRACAQAGVAVVPQGGNTGLVGGSVPLHGEVVISLRRLDALSEVADASGQVTVGAGVTLAALQTHVARSGWRFPVDLGSRDSATVGGMVATNAGGTRAVRYGMFRRHLAGVEAVLADGSVVSRLGGMEKDNTGYDLTGLLCGSEGTLAVVTAARLRLTTPLPEVVTACCAFDGLAAAAAAMGHLRRLLPSLDAAEFLTRATARLVQDQVGATLPFARMPPVVVVLECADVTDPSAAMAAALGSDGAAPLSGLLDVVVAATEAQRADMWRVRHSIADAVNLLGTPHKFDVTVPLDQLAGFCDEARDVARTVVDGAGVWMFGHLGDGNVHVNITGAAPDDGELDGAIFELVARHGGSISAEHGIGTAKARWLHHSRSRAELEAFEAIRTALDPHQLLNPHVLRPPSEPSAGR